MRQNYIILSTLFLLGLFTSCEEPVDFDLDDKARLVVTSHFSANKALVVYVTETKSVLDSGGNKFIENATISVFAGNEFIELLEFVGDVSQPFYKSLSLTPAVGEVYTIKVDVPGHLPVTATNSIPIPVQISNIAFKPTFGKDSEDNTVINFTVDVSIQDPEEHDNFYHLFFYQELIPYSIQASGDTLLSDQVYMGTDIDISLTDSEFPADKNYDKRSFLIEDATFNGQLVSIPFEGRYQFDHHLYIPGNFIVELRTVSRAYYDYYSSINWQTNNGVGSDPLNDNSVIIDNIDNGEGIFAGYSTSVTSAKLSN